MGSAVNICVRLAIVDAASKTVTVKHLKARHTQPKDLVLEFDRRTQRFAELENPTAWNPDGPGKPARGKLQLALASLWDRKARAADDDAGAPFGSGGESW